jgi:hypothetical protein
MRHTVHRSNEITELTVNSESNTGEMADRVIDQTVMDVTKVLLYKRSHSGETSSGESHSAESV